jgi:hypothetical protein
MRSLVHSQRHEFSACDVIAPLREPMTSSLCEELHEVAEELVEFDHVIVVLVDLVEERLGLLLDLGGVDRLAARLVVLREDRLQFAGRDRPAVVRVHDLEALPQTLLRVCLAARHSPAATAASPGAPAAAADAKML